MRVAIVDTAAAIPGGHRVQVAETSRSLSALGINVVPTAAADSVWPEVDLVHVYSADLALIRRARQRRIPVVVTPIYQPESWSYQLDGQLRGRAAVLRRVRLAAWLTREAMADRHISAAHELVATSESRRMVYESADLLLPNSEGEATEIATELDVTTPMIVVPNGVDVARFSAGTGLNRSGVLSVGRFEPHKNQLGLIGAMATIDAPLTLVGPPHPHHRDYAAVCRRRAGPRVRFIDELDHDGLLDIYSGAAVHVLPSWFETTGLASLEAAAAGCTIVTTSRGHAREYFEDDAYYCDPGSPRSLTSSIEAALRAPKPGARTRVRERYDWASVAAQTVAAYETVLT